MPQLWLTYDELGVFFGLGPEAARGDVIELGWARRRCSDGLTRVKLPQGTAHLYMMTYAHEAAERDAAEGHPVHRMQERIDLASQTIARRRVGRERDWAEPPAPAVAGAIGAGSPAILAKAVRRMLG
jgi:hypothetical protein